MKQVSFTFLKHLNIFITAKFLQNDHNFQNNSDILVLYENIILLFHYFVMSDRKEIFDIILYFSIWYFSLVFSDRSDLPLTHGVAIEQEDTVCITSFLKLQVEWMDSIQVGVKLKHNIRPYI